MRSLDEQRRSNAPFCAAVLWSDSEDYIFSVLVSSEYQFDGVIIHRGLLWVRMMHGCPGFDEKPPRVEAKPRCDDVTQAWPVHAAGEAWLSYSAAAVRSGRKRSDYLHERTQTSVPSLAPETFASIPQAFAAYWVTGVLPNGFWRILLNSASKFSSIPWAAPLNDFVWGRTPLHWCWTDWNKSLLNPVCTGNVWLWPHKDNLTLI